MELSIPSTWPNNKYSRHVKTGFHSWHIQRLGKSGGKKILFIHGTGSSCHSWSKTAEFLLSQYEILLIDLPGHGFSDLPAPNKSSLREIVNGSMDLLGKNRFLT